MQRKPFLGFGNLVPNQAAIDDLFAKADKIRVLQCGTREGVALGGPVLAEFEGAEQFAVLHSALQIAEPDNGFVCICSGTLAIEFLEGSSIICTLGYHHYRAIRHPNWASDVRLENGPGLAYLLASRGVGGPLSDYQSETGDLAIADVHFARRQWIQQAPSCLAWNLCFFEKHPELAILALKWAYPGVSTRCTILLRWLGLVSVESGWGLPEYQLLPERLLRRHNQRQVKDCILANIHDTLLARGSAVYLYLLLDFWPMEAGAPEEVLWEDLPDDFWSRVGSSIEDGPSRDTFLKQIGKIYSAPSV